MDSMSSIWERFAGVLMEVLPLSPFRQFLDDFSDIPFLGYLNWFVPVRGMLIVFSAWLTAVTVYYLYSIIMRWLRVIGS